MNEQPYYATGALPPRLYEYMLAGLLLFAGATAVTGYHVYHGFVTEEMARDRAYWGIGLPFVGVASGLYLFALGWQRGDVVKALRMSLWLSLGALGVIVAVLGVLAIKRHWRFGARALFSRRRGFRRRRSGWSFGGSDDGHDDGYYEDDIPVFDPTIYSDRTLDPGPEILTVHCRNCGDMFTPVPPRALCPHCGHSAIAG